ncbi:hypothetical protein [Streptomyces shenzhenensis]|uniref:hypothetical protein n=1 Tax=Streptomyces shenzhenensis TaxID=943815 RepID=UPI0036C76EE6
MSEPPETGLDAQDALRRSHSFHGAPEGIAAALRRDRVLPVATGPITQFDPALPDHDAVIRAPQLSAADAAPAPGRQPATEPEHAGV